MVIVVVSILIGPSGTRADASHFRASQINWSAVTANTVEFTVQNAWRRDSYNCLNPTTSPITFVPCTGPRGLPGSGDIIDEFVGNTQLIFGDGSPALGSPIGPLLYVVTSIDPTNNWLFAEALDPAALPALSTAIRHTYPSAGNFTAAIDSCCRISSFVPPNAHINNPDGPYRVETIVNAGTRNHSPVSALPPIVSCPQTQLCSFQVPGVDPDGDPVRFRLSTAAEAGGPMFVQPGPPFATNAAAISSTGVYTWNTAGARLGPPGSNTLYSTQVMIEDLDAAGNPKSKTAVDFFVQLVPSLGPPPVFTTPPGSPGCGSSITATVGVPLRFSAASSHPDPTHTVILNVVGLPLGAKMTPPLPVSGNPVSSQFEWTPTRSQIGTFVVTFTATDVAGQALGQQGLCSITVVAARRTRGVIYIHGINGDANRPGFDSLLTPLRGPTGTFRDTFATFSYFDDRANLQQNGQCAPQPVPPFTPVSGFPVTISQPAQCDSQDGIGLNAILLERKIMLQKATWNVEKITLINNSMGGAITRAYLAYATATNSPSLNVVDSVIFLQAAQEGSYLPKINEVGNNLSAIPGVAVALAAIKAAINSAFQLDLNRPAAADLTPQSRMYRFVNTPPFVPNTIRFANVASDISTHTKVAVWAWTFNGPTLRLGDYALVPGDDNPAATPFWGGARFDPSVIGRGRSGSVQYVLQGDVTFVLRRDAQGNPTVAGVSEVETNPLSHRAFGSSLGAIQITTPGGQRSLDLVLLDWISALDTNP